MRRDSLFYLLFSQRPTLLFELLNSSPPNADYYQFDSVAVKEPKFEIDGVFLPPPESPYPKIVYFCEVQFQKDELLYERLFGEAFLYFYRQRQRFDNWQAVIIYPSRTAEQALNEPYQALLNSNQVHRIYLSELGDPQQLSLGVGLMLLTMASQSQAPEQARNLLQRTQAEINDPGRQNAIMEMIITIMVYQFTQMSRREIEAMLDVQLQDSRVYQEAKEEGRQEGRQEGWQEGRQEEQLRHLERQRSLMLRLLTRKVGQLPEPIVRSVQLLNMEELEKLGEALLDFQTLIDVETGLNSVNTER